jgi:hypothetical protein
MTAKRIRPGIWVRRIGAETNNQNKYVFILKSARFPIVTSSHGVQRRISIHSQARTM